MHDLREQNFVTQGAFRAALLCKADQGPVKSQRAKLDIVCKLLVSAGILEEGDSGGLCVREHKEEESKPDVVQQASDGNGDNTVYLEESLARAEEDIARIEKVAAVAIEEARRVASIASRLRAQVHENCQQVQKCCDRLDESLEGSGERIETNSSRIFHLAAEVEGLSRTVTERGAAAKPARVAREETGEVFSVEIAHLPPQQTTATMEPPPEPAASPTQRRQNTSIVTMGESDEHGNTKGEDDIAPKPQQSDDLSDNVQAGDDHRQAPRSPRSLARMTANEAAEALHGITPNLGRRVNTTEEQDEPSPTAAAGMDTAFPGARLARLVDTPGLWCPRDTWDDAGAADLSSSEGSSTTAVVAEERRQRLRATE
eukprot:g8344.t1